MTNQTPSDETRSGAPTVLLAGVRVGESSRWHDGRLWSADWGARKVATVELDKGCFACALGGPDGRTLFMMANPMPPDFANPTGQVLTAHVSVPAATCGAWAETR